MRLDRISRVKLSPPRALVALYPRTSRPGSRHGEASEPRSRADEQALVKILLAPRGIGCRTYVIDDVRPDRPDSAPRSTDVSEFVERACSEHGAQRLEWRALARSAPGHERWMAADDIHMGSEGHLDFARELLKLWGAGR